MKCQFVDSKVNKLAISFDNYDLAPINMLRNIASAPTKLVLLSLYRSLQCPLREINLNSARQTNKCTDSKEMYPLQDLAPRPGENRILIGPA